MHIFRRLSYLAVLIASSVVAQAQQTDTTKAPAADTAASAVEAPPPPIDTALLSRFRMESDKDLLPAKFTPVEIAPLGVPVSNLDVEVSYWRKYFQFGLNLNQAAFSGNWAAGGVSSIAIGSVLNFKAEYKKDSKSFTSEIALLYGKLKNKDQLPRKTNDRMFFDNKMALQISKSWYFFGSLSFESQFDQGFSYSTDANGNEVANLISGFLAPGYITESLGFEYKPVNYFSLRLGTGTARQTIVRGDTARIFRTITNRYGLDPGKTFRNELAFQIVANFDKDIAKNMNLKWRYLMFASYDRFAFNRIDHRLDATLSARVNRLINVAITGTLYYDKDTDDKIQAFQGLTLGLLYKFPY